MKYRSVQRTLLSRHLNASFFNSFSFSDTFVTVDRPLSPINYCVVCFVFFLELIFGVDLI